MLEIKNLKSNEPFLEIEELAVSEHTVVIGNSGAGKTTLLRCIAGLQRCEGEFKIDNQVLRGVGPGRNISIIWQEPRLIPTLTAYENIKLGGDTSMLDYFAKLFKITALLDKYPHELSGGEQQRVNILRALCSKSRYVLLDEPMQGIDPIIVRKVLKNTLRELKKQNRIAIMVTHELYQVYGLFEKVIAIKRGRLVVSDDLQTVYNCPVTPWLANFFGPYVVLNRKDLRNFNWHSNEDPCMVRPEWFKIKTLSHKKLSECNATVIGVQWDGPSTKVSLELDGTRKTLTVEVNTDNDINKGERVYVNFKKCSRPSWIGITEC